MDIKKEKKVMEKNKTIEKANLIPGIFLILSP